MTIDIMELSRAILDGELDESFDAINAAMSGRKDILKRQAFHTFQEGDRVRVCNVGRPQYINGATGTIKEKRVTKITVQLDDDIYDPYGKWAGKGCILSPSQIEKLELVPSEGTVVEVPIT
jgi:hypothetical protein